MELDLTPKTAEALFEGDGGGYYTWSSSQVPLLAKNNVGAGRLVLQPRGFALPHYADSSKIGYVIQGTDGVVGMVLPNTKEEVVLKLKKGDVIPVPIGAVSWWFNDGDSDLIIAFLGETSKALVPGQFTYFFLTGALGLVGGFSNELTSKVYGLDNDEVEKLTKSQTGVLIIKLDKSQPMPKPQMNMTKKLVYNIDAARPENVVENAGLVKTLTEKDFPFIGDVGLSVIKQTSKLHSTMSKQPIDPFRHINIVLNPNGTLNRLRHIPSTAPSSDPTLPVLTKDITINQQNNTWLRLFLPRIALSPNPKKLPLIVFFHGSGFIVTSAASTMFHDFCAAMSAAVPAVVASVEYRLAPEHRLPAAYDDAAEALEFIRDSSEEEEWLTKHADMSNCYLMGSSAGATIAYFAGLRATDTASDLSPLKIRGLILRQVFFGGTQRSKSEVRLENDEVLPLCVTDLLWELALPVGVDRDHEYCNPRAEKWVGKMGKMRELGWRVLVSGNGGDPVIDREKDLVLLLEEKGVVVVSDFDEEGCHGVEFGDESKANQLIQVVKRFVS